MHIIIVWVDDIDNSTIIEEDTSNYDAFVESSIYSCRFLKEY